MISEQDVYAALKSVAGPDGKTPLPETGAIAGVTIRDDKVYLSLSVAPEQAASLESMRLAAEQAVRRLPGVSAVLVNLTAQKPGGQARRRSAARGPQRRRAALPCRASSASSPSPRARAASANRRRRSIWRLASPGLAGASASSISTFTVRRCRASCIFTSSRRSSIIASSHSKPSA